MNQILEVYTECFASARGSVFVAANFRTGEDDFPIAEGGLLLNLVDYPRSRQGAFTRSHFGHNAVCAGAMTAVLNLYQATSPDDVNDRRDCFASLAMTRWGGLKDGRGCRQR